MEKKVISAFLVLVVLSSSFYLLFDDEVRIDIGKTNNKYSVLIDDKFVLAATEYFYLYQGSTKLRAKQRMISYDIGESHTTAFKRAVFKDNITLLETLIFNNNESDIVKVPISHVLTVLNGDGLILQAEYRDILYEGNTKIISTPFSFGNNMKLEWDEQDSYYSKVFQQKVASDKIIVKSRIIGDNDSFKIRLYDPPKDIIVTQLQSCHVDYFNVSVKTYINCTEWNYNYSDCIHTAINGSCDEWSKEYYNTTCYNGTVLVEENKSVCENIGFNITLEDKYFYNVTGSCCGYYNETQEIVCKEVLAGVCNPVCQQTSDDKKVFDEYCDIYDITSKKISYTSVGEYDYVEKNKIKLSKIKEKMK